MYLRTTFMDYDLDWISCTNHLKFFFVNFLLQFHTGGYWKLSLHLLVYIIQWLLHHTTTTTTTTTLWPLYRTTCVSLQLQLKNWRILFQQSFTAHMPLQKATSTFGLRRRCWSSIQRCYTHCLRTIILLLFFKSLCSHRSCRLSTNHSEAAQMNNKHNNVT